MFRLAILAMLIAASRPLRPDERSARAVANNAHYDEPFAYDANDYADDDDADNDAAADDDDFYDAPLTVLHSVYHGLIKENETVVEITPLLKIDPSAICHLRIVRESRALRTRRDGRRPDTNDDQQLEHGFESPPDPTDIPFSVELIDDIGIVRARRSLNCEQHRNYAFRLAAVRCDGRPVRRTATVRIAVTDVNEYAPVFRQPAYVTEINEGRLYAEILRVEARDRDCTPLFGDVCKYELLDGAGTTATKSAFRIDNEGVIANVVPLQHRTGHNHILRVRAYDCAMRASESDVLVSIRVRRVCEARVLNVPERIDYVAGGAANGSVAALVLFPNVRLEVCDMPCAKHELVVEASVALKTKHISFGCDRSPVGQCPGADELIDLLPHNVDWTRSLTADEGADGVFSFDGWTGTSVPDDLLARHDFARSPFAIRTQFRHRGQPTDDETTGDADADRRHTKEHIVCSADDHKMNRHHMALFVRNCRLILLLRRNFAPGDPNIFSPAEWRWRLPHVCDNEWHAYALNVDPQTASVQLWIDGERFRPNGAGGPLPGRANPEVIDDWPMHSAPGINTTLAVGACWQASEQRMRHGFTGDVAEIRLALRRQLSDAEIRCGTTCAEYLTAVGVAGEPAALRTNRQQNEMRVVDGADVALAERALRSIHYSNSKRPTPTIGRRNIEIRATVSCPNRKLTRLPTMESYIMVSGTVATTPLPPLGRTDAPSVHVHDLPVASDQRPLIRLAGARQQQTVTHQDVRTGVRPLANVTVRVMLGGRRAPDRLQQIDRCTLTVLPALNPDHETLTLAGQPNDANDADNEIDGGAAAAAINGDIRTRLADGGAELVGADTTQRYVTALRRLVYTNRKPAYYLNRVFRVRCAQSGGAFRSDEFTVTLTVLHPKPMAPVAADDPQHRKPTGKTFVHSSAVDAHHHEQSSNTVYSHAQVHSHSVPEVQHTIVTHAASPDNHSTVLIAVICAAFVCVIAAIGVMRLRSALSNDPLAANGSAPLLAHRHEQSATLCTGHHRRRRTAGLGQRSAAKTNDSKLGLDDLADQAPQLDWDDSALTITMNPMRNLLGPDDCGETALLSTAVTVDSALVRYDQSTFDDDDDDGDSNGLECDSDDCDVCRECDDDDDDDDGPDEYDDDECFDDDEDTEMDDEYVDGTEMMLCDGGGRMRRVVRAGRRQRTIGHAAAVASAAVAAAAIGAAGVDGAMSIGMTDDDDDDADDDVDGLCGTDFDANDASKNRYRNVSQLEWDHLDI